MFRAFKLNKDSRKILLAVSAFGFVAAVGMLSSLTRVQAEDSDPDSPPRELGVVLESAAIQYGTTATPAHLRSWYLNPFKNAVIECERSDFAANQVENRNNGSEYLPGNLQECVHRALGNIIPGSHIAYWMAGETSLPVETAKNILHTFISRPALANSVINYAVPLARTLASQLSPEGRAALREALVSAQTYANNLQGAELVAERNYALGAHSRSFALCPRESVETNQSCMGSKRAIEAFIYRRIAGGLTRQFVVSKLQVAIDILAPAAPAN